MNGKNKISQIGEASWMIEQYTPITSLSNPYLFRILSSRFEKVENTFETIEISRDEFEKLLYSHEELIDVYLDEYSKEAFYFECVITYGPRHFQYFMMKKNNRVVLFFYRNIEYIEYDSE
jgi:hypothetical protein